MTIETPSAATGSGQREAEIQHSPELSSERYEHLTKLKEAIRGLHETSIYLAYLKKLKRTDAITHQIAEQEEKQTNAEKTYGTLSEKMKIFNEKQVDAELKKYEALKKEFHAMKSANHKKSPAPM